MKKRPKKKSAAVARRTYSRTAGAPRARRPARKASSSRSQAEAVRLRAVNAELEIQHEEVRIQNLRLIDSQKLLEESRDRYADLYDSLPIPYLTLDEKGEIVNANVPACEMLGLARPNLIQSPFIHFVDKPDKRLFLDRLHHSRATAQCPVFELTLVTRTRQRVPVQILTILGLTADGERLRLHIALIDLTAQRRAEAERERLRVAQRNEVLLRDILEALPVGVRLVDPSGALVIENEASRRLFDENRAVPGVVPYWGRAWSSETGESLSRRQWPVCQVLDGGEAVFNRMIELEPAPGAPRKTIRSSAVPLNEHAGNLIGVVLVHEDLTEMRNVQRALEQAKEAAEAASRLKDEFLATLSHELRTPISAILLWTHLLQTTLKDEAERAGALETIVGNAKLQSQLINDLLDLSRVASAKMRVELLAQEVVPVVASAIESVRPVAQAKRIALNTHFERMTLGARLDKGRLEQVLLNLLNNAINFTPAGGQVDVAVRHEKGVIQIEVADTGQGIARAFLPYVFDRFRQADASTTRAHGGLGLGLAIARELVLMHGGTIRADSAGEGRGATFTVELPAVELKTGNVRSNAAGGRPLDGLHILLVEDEPATGNAITHILADAGAHVTASENAQAALEVFRAAPPDLIISDIAMPDQDGYALLRAIRQIEASKSTPERNSAQVPAIALTAYASPADVRAAAAEGFGLHLSKPVEPAVLVETVARFARRHGKLASAQPKHFPARRNGKPIRRPGADPRPNRKPRQVENVSPER